MQKVCILSSDPVPLNDLKKQTKVADYHTHFGLEVITVTECEKKLLGRCIRLYEIDLLEAGTFALTGGGYEFYICPLRRQLYILFIAELPKFDMKLYPKVRYLIEGF
jgi:hypothetical protein